MKHLIYLMLALICPTMLFSQDIAGLWKGTLFNDSTKQTLQYEIVINKVKGKFTGFTQTWFMADEKKYYGIKKINIRVTKDGKIIMQDAGLVEENFSMFPNKNVFQLNVLDITNRDDETNLDGLFVTNCTKNQQELTGHINVKRVNALSESDLVKFLNKNSNDNTLTAEK